MAAVFAGLPGPGLEPPRREEGALVTPPANARVRAKAHLLTDALVAVRDPAA